MLSMAASEIKKSHEDAILDYHRHLDDLYERLIGILDKDQVAKLRGEKAALERQIDLLSTSDPSSP